MATRCFWPPDSSLGRCSMRSAKPTEVEGAGGLLAALVRR